MKLKEIEWKVCGHDSTIVYISAYVGPFIFGFVVAVPSSPVTYRAMTAGAMTSYEKRTDNNLGVYTDQSEAKAAVESKIKEWFNQVTE